MLISVRGRDKLDFRCVVLQHLLHTFTLSTFSLISSVCVCGCISSRSPAAQADTDVVFFFFKCIFEPLLYFHASGNPIIANFASMRL